jgi:hypothetical protein
VNEVVVTYGANKAMLAPGQIFVTQQLHGVNSFLRDEKDPEAFAVMVITQHQSTSGDQREAVLARCKKCKAELVRHEYCLRPWPTCLRCAKHRCHLTSFERSSAAA